MTNGAGDGGMVTERLALREASTDDAPVFAQYYARNAERFRPWREHRSHHVEDWNEWLAADSRSARAGVRTYVASLPDLRDIVAIVWLSQWDAEGRGDAELGYTVDGAYEGRGYMFEAVSRIVGYARAETDRRVLLARYDVANARSAALLARLGFVEYARSTVVPGYEQLMRAQVQMQLALYATD